MHDDTPRSENKRYAPYKQFVGAVAPNWLMKRTDISQGAKLCFARLAQFAGKNDCAFPGHKKLAEELGVSIPSIKAYLRELTGLGIIQSKPMGSGNFSLYFFVDQPGIVEFKTDSQETILQSAKTDSQENIPQTRQLKDRKPRTEGQNPIPAIIEEENQKRIRRESEENQQENQTHALPIPDGYNPKANRVIALWHEVAVSTGLGFLAVDLFTQATENAIARYEDDLEGARFLFDHAVKREREQRTQWSKNLCRVLNDALSGHNWFEDYDYDKPAVGTPTRERLVAA